MAKSPKDFTPEQRNILSQLGVSPEGRPEIGMPLHNWSENLQAAQNVRAQNPVQSPVAAGTPTQRRLDANEQKRQFDEQMRFNREQAAAARRASYSGGGSSASAKPYTPTRNDAMTSIRTLVGEAIRRGEGWSWIQARLNANAGLFDKNTMTMEEALQVAYNNYKDNKYTPTGEAKPVYDYYSNVYGGGAGDAGAGAAKVQIPDPVEDMNSTFQRLFPDQYDRGITAFEPPLIPKKEEKDVKWYNPLTWF